MLKDIDIAVRFEKKERAVVYPGDCLELLGGIPDSSIQLVVTSPPYNIGKEYETRLNLDHYVEQQRAVIRECVRVLDASGSICWQVGNYVENGSIVPLDTILYPVFSSLGLKMRNRIIWHFEHGLHCSKRFSGRYETINWFTKTDSYTFDLDPVRVPQKYPGKKHFKGPNAGQYSCNPLGKSPGDVWTIPNVKSNHVEKTEHPCQFPVELIERLVLSMTREGDWVLDPFLGVGTTIAAAIRHNRRGAGAEIVQKYCAIAKARIQMAAAGTLRVRPMGQPIFDPKNAGASLVTAPWKKVEEGNGKHQMAFFEKPRPYGSRK
jgi:DNA modification methylase